MTLKEVPGYLEGSKKRVEGVTTAETNLFIAENPERSQDGAFICCATQDKCMVFMFWFISWHLIVKALKVSSDSMDNTSVFSGCSEKLPSRASCCNKSHICEPLSVSF